MAFHLTLAHSQPPVEVPRPSALFVLGDSLSDVGNAAAISDFLLSRPFYPEYTNGLCNPVETYLGSGSCEDLFYGKSRVSDGPVAVEHLAAQLGLGELQPSFHVVPSRPLVGTNYAVAGGRAVGTGAQDLPQQIQTLLFDYGPALPADALYVVMIGGNDARDALAAVLPPEPAVTVVRAAQSHTAVIAQAVAAIGAGIERLIDYGARQILVANVPDLSLLPAVRRAAAGENEWTTLAAAAAITAAFNEQLEARVARIEAERGIALVRFDFAAFLRNVTAAPEPGRIVADGCFDSETYWLWKAERVFHPSCAPLAPGAGARFAQFVFWDAIHPTGAAHEALAAAMLAAYAAALAPS